MQEKVINLYKRVGETPLERIERFRYETNDYKDLPLSYAGRLDPLAEGVLLVLVGEENKNQKDYFGLEKEYEVEVLLGYGSDTQDILGIAEKNFVKEYTIEEFKKACETYIGTYEEEYPPYSSKPVNGKPLFYWARAGKLNEIEIPKNKITINKIEFIDSKILNNEELLKMIIERVNLVGGDFRQEEIKENWKRILVDDGKNQIFRIKVSCGSGAYMRTLALRISEKIGTKGLAFSIRRTRVGDFKIEESLA